MKWYLVKKFYPNKFVLVREISSHYEGNMKYLDDFELLDVFDNKMEAVTAMVRSDKNVYVYDTASKEEGFKVA